MRIGAFAKRHNLSQDTILGLIYATPAIVPQHGQK